MAMGARVDKLNRMIADFGVEGEHNYSFVILSECRRYRAHAAYLGVKMFGTIGSRGEV